MIQLCVCVCVLSCVGLFANPQTGACQAPLPVGFSRQEHWSGLQFPSLGYLSDPGIEHVSLASPPLAGGFFTTAQPGMNHKCILFKIFDFTGV